MEVSKKIWEKEDLTHDEYKQICKILGRKPNYTELGIYGVMWSEHCSYKNSKPILKKFPTKGTHILQGPGENAGIVDIGNEKGIVFKIESHNHPSAIEPYQGAATGVGGIVRDIFTMGARPIALLNSLRFGNIKDKHVKYLFTGIVKGIADYGNSIGIPTVGGETYFSNTYKGNPLVNVMCVGIVDHSHIAKGIAKGIENPVMVVGATTGRDGIKGASFASDELTEESENDRPSVQIGDPFMEKLLLEATLELIQTGVIVGIQDMGAAGLISSSSEMASRGNTGIEMDIALIPKRETGMSPYEILLSESQERMLVVIEKGKEHIARKIFKKWGLNAVTIGKVTSDKMIRILERGKTVAEVPASSLAADAPVYYRKSKKPLYIDDVRKFNISSLPSSDNYNELFLKILSSPNMASKKWIYEQYDHMVQTNTVLLPGSDSAVLRIKGTKKGIAITIDGNGRYTYLDPETGGAIAVAEAARNITSSGAKPLALTDGMNFGNPMDPEIFYQFEKSAEGIKKACLSLNTPVTGGNVSFYNKSPKGAIYPTPIIGMIGLLEDINLATDIKFKNEGDIIILMGETKDELGGSEYLEVIHGIVKGIPPEINFQLEKNIQNTCLSLIKKGVIKSAHDISDGGIAINIAESIISGNIGAKIEVDISLNPISFLFSETQSRIVITISKNNLEKVEALLKTNNTPYSILGKVGGDKLIINNLVNLNIKKMEEIWEKTITSLVKN